MLEKSMLSFARSLPAEKFVALVRGNCLGGGAELAMVCDLVYTTSQPNGGSGNISGLFPAGCMHCVGDVDWTEARS